MATEPGPVVLRTLADHQAFTLSAFCQACDRSVPLDKDQLADSTVNLRRQVAE